MSRSERYVPPTARELERLRQAEQAARQFDQDRQTLLRAALNRTKKVDIVKIVLELAQEEMSCQWTIERELGLKKPVALLVHDVEAAIKIATKVDERRLNYNFDYEWRAYEAIQRGLTELVEMNALDEAKALALKLMSAGSYQMECSDEGLMREDIEACLRPVIAVVATTLDARAWALEMLSCDLIGSICASELTDLAAIPD